jgi:DNA-binding MarR family transcriptional regulator
MHNGDCFNLAMRKSSRLITQFYQERLSKTGLKVGQFSILRAVNFCKETSNKELQSILVLDQTTLSRNLKPLIRDGYLKLSAHSEDGRQKIISLSPAGLALYQETLPIWQAAQDELQQKIGTSETDNILALTDIFVKALGN